MRGCMFYVYMPFNINRLYISGVGDVGAVYTWVLFASCPDRHGRYGDARA